MPASDWRASLCSDVLASTSLATRASRTRGARRPRARTAHRQAPVLRTAAFLWAGALPDKHDVGPATIGSEPPMTDLPVACTLSPAALRARREGLLSELVRRADEHEDLPEGHRLRFAGGEEVLLIIARAVEAERQCCRFLRFEITVEPDGGPISLSSRVLRAPGSSLPPCSIRDHKHSRLCRRSLLRDRWLLRVLALASARSVILRCRARCRELDRVRGGADTRRLGVRGTSVRRVRRHLYRRIPRVVVARRGSAPKIN